MLDSPGLENIPQLPGNRAEVGQNHYARKAVSATISGLSEAGLYFGPESPKCAFEILGRNIASLHFKTATLADPRFANRDFDQLRSDIPELGGYFPVLGTLN